MKVYDPSELPFLFIDCERQELAPAMANDSAFEAKVWGCFDCGFGRHFSGHTLM